MVLIPKKKSEQIKLFLLLGGCLLFVLVGYFRSVPKKPPAAAARTLSDVPPGQMQVPRVEIEMPPKVQIPQEPAEKLLPASVRDIFSPAASTPGAKGPFGLEAPAQQLSAMMLKGTIVGGGKPLAIINDQFVGQGEWIGKYQVIGIGKNEVVLDSGQHQIKLEIVKDE
jgi:hypothetical protein